jgi:hypothetical protein
MSNQGRKDLATYGIYEEDERCMRNIGQKMAMRSNYSGDIGESSN